MKNYENNKKVKLIALAAMIATLICAVIACVTWLLTINTDKLTTAVTDMSTMDSLMPTQSEIRAPEHVGQKMANTVIPTPTISDSSGVGIMSNNGRTISYYYDPTRSSGYMVAVSGFNPSTMTTDNWGGIGGYNLGSQVGSSFDIGFTANSGYVFEDGSTSVTLSASVKPMPISRLSITNIADQEYTGSAITPTTSLRYSNVTLSADTDYTLTYSNNINVGTAKVIITCKGNYSGSLTKTFNIVQASLSSANVYLNQYSFSYDGSQHCPGVVFINVNGRSLTGSTDYTVSYKNNIEAGSATIIFTGKGNYTGSCSTTYQITSTSINNATVTLSSSSYTYNGTTNKPSVAVKLGSNIVSSSNYSVSYSDNINVGTATVTVTGKNSLTDSVNKTFTINKASASSATVTLSSTSYTYDGTQKKPAVTVKLGNVSVSTSNYTVNYSNNINVGTATVTITFINNFISSTTNKTFKISEKSISGATIATIADQTYTGGAIKPTPSVTLSGYTPTYSVSYSNNTNVGTATVTITGTGNFSGTASKTFSIVAKSISGATISSISAYTYDGSEKKPQPTVTLSGYTPTVSYSYSSNVNAGTDTATVTIKGTGNFSGTLTKKFTINARNISNATFGTIDTQYYNKGAAITPTPTITDTNISKTLVDGTDFTFSYSDNINAGTATITVTGKGNYTGTKSTTFTISGSLLSNATIGEITSQTYDGTEKKPTATVTLDGVTLSSGTDFTFGWSDNVNAGTATLTITGKGNYAGTNSKTFEISARSISNATAAEIAAQGYTASAKTPLPALTDLSRTLTKDTDYTLEYADNVNVGTAKITITGKGNYNGTKEVTFTITARNISGATVPAIPAQTYTGSAIEPLPEVTDLSITLVRGTDFTVTYKDNVNVGTATLILTGMGNYTGTKEIVFSIQPPTVADATVTISESSFTYDGSAKEPRVTLVQIGDLTLRAGVDFTVSYSANVNAGTAKVIVTGAGDYVGTKEVTFTINPADIANATVNGLQLTYVYTGSGIEPEITVTFDGVTLILNTDYLITYSDNINVGTATVTVAGSKNYTGTLTDTFVVIKADISHATVTGIEASYEYTGNAIAPEPTVTWNGTTLVKDTDYTVSFADNTALGTATVTITGIGNFSGSIIKNFEIVQADISTAEISGINASYDFTGSAITPEPSVIFNGVTLVKDTDYTVGYADNVNTGTATVTVTGTGNYTGVITKNFVIGEADMDGVTVTGIDPTYEYTGSAIAPEPTVTYNGITLVKDADYTVEYSDNIELGIVTVTITGCGNFNSVTTVTFEIVQANIANATVTGVNESYEYTGSAITPEPVVTLNGVTLEKNVDYTVSYVNNTVTGTAVINLTGTGNYKGINSAVFNIVRADISDAEVTGIAEEYQWTGSEIIPEPTLVLNGVTLVQNTDYVVICDGNIEVGTVTYTITAVGYYTGSIGGTFEIVKATPQVEVTYTDYNGIDTLFVGDALPAITATATYNGVTVSGIVSWDTDGGVAPALKDGENDYNWTFTPDDTDHYALVTGYKTLNAEEPTYADIRVEWKNGAQPELFTSTSVSVILRNLKVTGIFNNGTENEIIGSFTFVGSWDTSGAESTAAMPATGGDNYYITVKFGRHSKPVYDIKIDDVILEELVYSAADGGEIKTDYTALDGFDTASVKVTAKYNDGSEKVLPSGNKGYTVAYENGADSLQFGDTKITLSYTEAGVTATVEIGGLTVSKKPFDDTVLTFNPADADYDFGNSVTGGVTVENLPDWLKVTYVYEDEEGNILDPSAVRNAGTYKVTAKFTVDNNHEEIDDITATFTINKIDPVLTPAVGGSLAAGTQLGDLTFSAGNGATAGTLVWDDSTYELKEGINRCYYTFTPDDTVNFKVVHGYVDVMAEVPAPEDISGGNLVGWQIALIVVSIAVAVLALIALIVALKSHRTTDSDGFYDDATEEDLKN